MRTCDACKHFQANPESAGQGICRRYPPVPFPTAPGQITSMSPPVQDKQTCGEWGTKIFVAQELPPTPAKLMQ